MPNFFDLADKVINKLHISIDHPVYKILNETKNINNRIGISGFISADRIFGLLERDFDMHVIEAAVAETLKLVEDMDLSAHQILLDLATTPEGKIRLVTTNFDRLFESACCRTPNIWRLHRLPDPFKHNEFDGVIYLHGCATKDYTRAEGDGFILSTSQFGRAYILEGWATQFFKKIIDHYVVVFVGYTADDPPVMYLLEALNKKTGGFEGVYAFQSGLENEATSNWSHKGVKAITYAENDGHQTLWETLNAWAKRAKSPDEWYKSVINLAKKGPEQLQPHERGQVAHLISTITGAKKFSERDNPPPAEWLCVFDSSRRYARPGHAGFGMQGPFIDPFKLYGLDSDIKPEPIDPNDYSAKREVPKDAWDGFVMNRLDRQNLSENNLPVFRGYWATNVPSLPLRLSEIGTWIMKISDQHTSVWWAAGQSGLHPDIQKRIQRELELSKKNNVSSVIHQAWQYIFESWEKKEDDFNHEWYEMKKLIDKNGWNSSVIRRFAIISRPYLKVKQNHLIGPKPPEWKKDIRIQDMLKLKVNYPDFIYEAKIPDKWLAFTIQELRKNLEYALTLETEISEHYGFRLNDIRPILHDDASNVSHNIPKSSLSGYVIAFLSLYRRLIKFDITSAKQEVKAWPINDDTIFSRLRIWAAGKRELISTQAFGPVIMKLSDKAFWNDYHQGDLLLVLKDRWSNLSEKTRLKIENRLIQGRAKWNNEDEVKYQERKAWKSLNRIHWLAKNGCEFTFDLNAETKKLHRLAPDWKPKYAEKAAESRETRGGYVRIKTEYSELLNEPLGNILAKAFKLSGKAIDSLVENDPFAGLSKELPVKAFSALTNAAKSDKYPEWAWGTFLNAEARKNDRPKFSALIAERISRYPDDSVAKFIYPVSDWLLKISQKLSSSFPQSFDNIMSKLINLFQSQRSFSSSAIIRGDKEPDWMLEAINAPVGKIAQALFNDSRTENLKAGGGFPDDWLFYVNSLLSLKDDLRRYALVIFAYALNWFYDIDPIWTEDNILSALEKDDELDKSSLCSGFFSAGKMPSQNLYMRLKPYLLTLAKQHSLSPIGYNRELAEIILAGWGNNLEKTGERWISNDEMRDVLLHADDEFRSFILWQIERRLDPNKNDSWEKWPAILIELLSNVWPLQKSVKTSKMSACLFNLAFSNEKYFPEIVKNILPLLTTIDHEHLHLLSFCADEGNIIDWYPRQTFDILYAILPENTANWPYCTGTILKKLGEADKRLKSDERFIELNRKWNSR